MAYIWEYDTGGHPEDDSYIWEFFTGGRPVDPLGRRCHRGPMIDVEITMSRPFTYMVPYNTLRQRLLNSVVDTDNVAVQTREVVLRSLNTELGPMFLRLASRKKSLQALICEKKNSVIIEQELRDLNPFYLDAARQLYDYGLPQPQVDLLVEALTSNSPVLRVAGKCAAILIAAFTEMDYHNG
jgi:hypothetical protein